MPRGLAFVFAAAFSAALFGAHHTAAGDTSILEYDSQGRLQQLRDVTTQSGAAGQGAGAEQGAGKATGAGFNPALWYEPGEVIVANAPEGFEFAASLSGFRTLETLEFKALHFKLPDLDIAPRLKTDTEIAPGTADITPGLHHSRQPGDLCLQGE